jgi:hypothetical protein
VKQAPWSARACSQGLVNIKHLLVVLVVGAGVGSLVDGLAGGRDALWSIRAAKEALVGVASALRSVRAVVLAFKRSERALIRQSP